DDLKKRLADAGSKLVVIDFHATWCGPCKMIGPKVEELAGEHTEVVFVKVDVDECEDIATEYNVNSMPTFKFIKDGKVVDTLVGANVDKLDDLKKRLADAGSKLVVIDSSTQPGARPCKIIAGPKVEELAKGTHGNCLRQG
ncbi:Similar to Trx-2: Thioredoxin-2 (Drosophila yakuba), partial [Cotesia congregata]